MRILNIKQLAAVMAFAAATGSAYAASPDTFADGSSYYGSPGGAASAARLVDVAAVKYLGVAYGETVTFRSEGKQFTWTFNGLDHRAVELSKIAPAGFPTKAFKIYVAGNPLTRN